MRKILIVNILIVLIVSISGCGIDLNNNYSGCSINSQCDSEIKITDNIQLIGCSEFTGLIDNNYTDSVILIGRDTCKWCLKVKEYINSLGNISQCVNYLQLDNLNFDEMELLEDTLLEKLSTDELAIPIVLRIKNGVIKDFIIGVPYFDNIDDELFEIWLENTMSILMKGE